MASAPRHPALDVLPVGDDRLAEQQSPLPLVDAVAVVVDDFSPFAIEPRGRGGVRVYFTSEDDRDAARAAVAAVCGQRVRTTATAVADEDWAARSQADLHAIQVGRVVIAPPWDLPPRPPHATEVVVQIRPALGFGSGHHASTRLALLGLQQLDLRERDVLDLGTGSGVLAIAAIKLGARRATGIDRDPDALTSARASVAVNHVASRVALRDGDVSTLALDPVAVVAANLTGATLIDLAPVITQLAEPGGHLVLGGILAEEEHAVTQAYRAWTHPVWRGVEEEWVGLVLRQGTREG